MESMSTTYQIDICLLFYGYKYVQLGIWHFLSINQTNSSRLLVFTSASNHRS